MLSLATARVLGIVLVSSMLLSLFAAHQTISARATSGPTLFIAPSHQALASPGSTVTFDVNVSNIDPNNQVYGWAIYVMTNKTVLNPVSITLGSFLAGPSDAQCINDVAPPGVTSACGGNDTPGVAHDEVTSGTGNSGNGTLFTITYDAGAGPFTFVTLFDPSVYTVLYDVLGSNIPFTPVDGDYGNVPPLPVARFTYSPLQPFVGDLITFNATTSSPAPGGPKLVDYLWTFAEVTTTYAEGNFPITSHVFGGGNWSVTLVVKDAMRISSRPYTLPVNVNLKPNIDLSVSGGLSTYPIDDILAGTPVTIKVNVANFGTVPETGFNVSVSVAGKVLTAPPYTAVLAPSHVTSFSFVWNTTGITPDVYTVHAHVGPPVGQVDTADTDSFAVVRIIYAFQGAPIPISVLEFLGLSLLLIVVAGAILSLSRRILNRRTLAKRELL